MTQILKAALTNLDYKLNCTEISNKKILSKAIEFITKYFI